eukprot:8651115-Heterocapsa_arctica.AAC.1
MSPRPRFAGRRPRGLAASRAAGVSAGRRRPSQSPGKARLERHPLRGVSPDPRRLRQSCPQAGPA